MSRSPRRALTDAAIVLVALAATVVGLSSWVVGGEADGRDGSSATEPDPPCTPPDRRALVPADGVWLGASIDWEHHPLAAYADRLGRAPAVTVTFVDVPLSAEDAAEVDAAAQQARGVGSMLLLTLEPHGGLDTVTEGVARRSPSASTATPATGCRSSSGSRTR